MKTTIRNLLFAALLAGCGAKAPVGVNQLTTNEQQNSTQKSIKFDKITEKQVNEQGIFDGKRSTEFALDNRYFALNIDGKLAAYVAISPHNYSKPVTYIQVVDTSRFETVMNQNDEGAKFNFNDLEQASTFRNYHEKGRYGGELKAEEFSLLGRMFYAAKGIGPFGIGPRSIWSGSTFDGKTSANSRFHRSFRKSPHDSSENFLHVEEYINKL